MTDKGFDSLLFAGSGFSFDEIVRTVACGGKVAVIKYLECRRRIFIREMNNDPTDDPNGQGYLSVLAALDTALSLFDQFIVDSSNDGVAQDSDESAS
ncbi:hypothetical protein [Ochrobactrum sp. Marseille-Q0166]|uniref:hypothetical protein n=1 Tax=Ochrobactrum sp. Marseille-Q0166 TaxID=2761105 RepID=UPI0016564E71|nr:hypothetical protein [Ochrobactrum sp. Marseille-Q0166]MBC8719587.1 hypothetical protein [Ochrobactrum sp. Marseille-Q0166]